MKELRKQLIDQTAHVFMGIVSVCLFAWLTKSIWFAVGITVAWEAFREYQQWPSSRIYDPYLDAFFEIAGIIAGYFVWVKFLG